MAIYYPNLEQGSPEWHALRYELMHGYDVEQTGFCIERAETFSPGCSPDGIIAEDGGIEIKCPEPWTHMQTIIEGKMPSKHIAQTQGFLFVTGREWCDKEAIRDAWADGLPVVILQPGSIPSTVTETGEPEAVELITPAQVDELTAEDGE